jgi:hypothetical protein
MVVVSLDDDDDDGNDDDDDDDDGTFLVGFLVGERVRTGRFNV